MNKGRRSLSKVEALQLEHDLMYFTGSNKWFRHWSQLLLYTEGVEHMAERAGAYWLIDIIASWQAKAHVRRELFQVWRLRHLREQGRDQHAAIVEMGIDLIEERRLVRKLGHDGRPSVLGPVCSQEIPYTDFPLPNGIKLYVAGHCPNAVLMLPSER